VVLQRVVVCALIVGFDHSVLALSVFINVLHRLGVIVSHGISHGGSVAAEVPCFSELFVGLLEHKRDSVDLFLKIVLLGEEISAHVVVPLEFVFRWVGYLADERITVFGVFENAAKHVEGSDFTISIAAVVLAILDRNSALAKIVINVSVVVSLLLHNSGSANNQSCLCLQKSLSE